MVIGPRIKLKLKPKFKKSRSGRVDPSSKFNIEVAKQRAEIEASNRRLRSLGLPSESFPGETLELKRKRIQQETERQRQEKISEGRISPQAETQAKSLSFERFDPQEFKFTSGFRREPEEATKTFFTEAIPEFVSGLGKAIGPALLMDVRELKKIDPFRVFKDVGPRAGERKVLVPQFGTVTPDSRGGFIETTPFELLKERRRQAGVPEIFIEAPISVIAAERVERVEREVVEKFQPRVDVGEITPEAAQKEAEKIFRKRVTEETRGLERLGAERLRVRTGETISKQVKGFLPAVGLTALSLTPTGSIIGGSLSIGGGAFLATRGRRKIEEGQVASGIADIGTGALFAAGGFAALGGAAGRLEAQITASRLATLQQQPVSIGGDFTIGKRGVITRVTGARVTEFGTQQIEVISPVFTQKALPSGSQTFSIVGGRVVSKTRLEPFRFIGGFATPKVAILKTTEQFTFIGRGLAPATTTGRIARQGFTVDFPKDFKSAAGTIDFVSGGKRITTPFGGISKRGGEGIQVISGPITKGRVSLPAFGGKRAFIIKPEAAGTLIEKPAKEFFLDFKVIRTGGIPITPKTPVIPIPTKITPIVKPTSIIGDITRTGGAFRGITAPPVSTDFSAIGFPSGPLSQTLSIQKFQVSQIGAGFGAGARVATITKPTVDLIGRFSAPTVSFLPTSRVAERLDVAQSSFLFTRTETITKTQQPQVTPTQLSESRVSQRQRQPQRTKIITEPPLSPVVPIVVPPARAAIGAIAIPSVSTLPFGFLPLPTFPTGTIREPRRKKPRGAVAPSITGLTLFQLGDITGGPLPTSGLPGLSLVPESFVEGSKKKKKKDKIRKSMKSKTKKKK